jgi:lipopolysaccharide/colanic/teichoic acid biosynthesis glycosyltransferase
MEVAVSHRPLARAAGTAVVPAYDRPVRRRPVHADTDLRLLPTEVDVESQGDGIEGIVPRERSEPISRAVNVAIAAVALVLFAPVLAMVALFVKLTSPGPILYQQTRIGVDRRFREKSSDDRRTYDHGGKPFRMYKFRTMRTDAEADGKAVWAAKKDPRTTSVGAVLRRFRIDEIPQLYNVIRGDMNIVGPRPERPTLFAELRRDIPEYQMRQRVKPGITGWAQVNQAYDSSVDDVRRKVSYDLEYLRRQSVLEDLRIMSMTLPVMLFRRFGW